MEIFHHHLCVVVVVKAMADPLAFNHQFGHIPRRQGIQRHGSDGLAKGGLIRFQLGPQGMQVVHAFLIALAPSGDAALGPGDFLL